MALSALTRRRDPGAGGNPQYMDPIFFETPVAFRAWLEEHHAVESQLIVGFYKRGSGRPSMTWDESVDEALCFGWIDGVRRSLGEDSYSIRFTPRKPTSIWSTLNVSRVAELEKQGRMAPAGRRAFAARAPERTGVYSFEQDTAAGLTPEEESGLRANARAAAFFDAQPPWYRRAATHWIASAKRSETRRRRLAQLISDSEDGRTVPPLTRRGGRPAPKASEGD
jgi:uncharacterized protein YdeI (YjbR/CyaY-like superfamily)